MMNDTACSIIIVRNWELLFSKNKIKEGQMIHSSLFSFFSYFFLLFNSIATKVELTKTNKKSSSN